VNYPISTNKIKVISHTCQRRRRDYAFTINPAEKFDEIF
jgi:hypothetical protein